MLVEDNTVSWLTHVSAVIVWCLAVPVFSSWQTIGAAFVAKSIQLGDKVITLGIWVSSRHHILEWVSVGTSLPVTSFCFVSNELPAEGFPYPVTKDTRLATVLVSQLPEIAPQPCRLGAVFQTKTSSSSCSCSSWIKWSKKKYIYSVEPKFFSPYRN